MLALLSPYHFAFILCLDLVSPASAMNKGREEEGALEAPCRFARPSLCAGNQLSLVGSTFAHVDALVVLSGLLAVAVSL